MDSKEEKRPLLSDGNRSGILSHSGSVEKSTSSNDVVKLRRHINLPYAVFIIFGNVVGSGIFVSPKGVTENIGSVGGSLIVWGATGFYNLAQAWCYTELATVIPKAGGDYAFIYYILGPLPAFLCGWVHVAIIASSSCAVIARTGALYLLQPLGLGDQVTLITLLAIFFIVTLATVNAVSVKWGMRIHTFFSIAKLLALVLIITTGIVKLAQGNTGNFENAFSDTTTDPGKIAISILDGYFAYKGWELVMALPEEMVNPKKDLPRAVLISMTLVTAVYVLTNMAYFSVLSKSEMLMSDAVAVTFAERTFGSASWIIPISVCLSTLGTVNGDFLSNSRYLFAAGRYKQLPQMFSMIHIKFYTPFLAVAMLAFIALLYTAITDLQVLQEYSSLTVQVKVVLALAALFYLRWKRPDLERPIKVNILLAVITLIIMLALLVLSFYKSPTTTGVGVGLFILGVPLYYLGQFGLNRVTMNKIMDNITVVIQKLFLIAPETIFEGEEEEMDPLKLRKQS